MPNTRVVETNNPEREIWNFVSSFENEHFVRSFAKDRISKKFHGYDFDSLNQKKSTRNDVEILQPLQYADEVVTEVSRHAKQARDFYYASTQLPLLSRPILLHYAFEKLANVLILLTFRITRETFSHGLTYPQGNPIMVKRNGLYQRFHDCYSTDPSICLEEYSFKLENLLDAGSLYEHDLLDMMRLGKTDAITIYDETSGKMVTIAEMDREFILVFGLSALARYRVNEWSDIIEGKTTEIALRIERYLQSIQSFFPNLVLNALYGETILFFTPARVA